MCATEAASHFPRFANAKSALHRRYAVLLQMSVVGVSASCSLKMPMICSSLNRELFIIRLLRADGLYQNLVGIMGLRSTSSARRHREAAAADWARERSLRARPRSPSDNRALLAVRA